MRRRSRLVGGIVLGSILGVTAPSTAAEPPLHERIDRAIEAKLDAPSAAPATDAEFLRRVYLDLAGMIPTAAEAKQFLDDPSPYKRERLIDQLLNSQRYVRRMRDVLDLLLMERLPDKYVSSQDWRAYLQRAVAENRPYDRLVAELLSADGVDSKTAPRAAAKFLLDREADPNNLTRDIGRLFLGRDLQCAQCHDHPLIDDYKQAHYYGLFAFLGRTSLFDDPNAGKVLAEKGEGDVTFSSVFKKKLTHSIGPRILDSPPIDEPSLPKGQEYAVPAAKGVRPIPTFSRRQQLAPALTEGAVPEFDRTIANRLWALMMGRGLIHPLDMDHAANPPSHPELLDDLARSFRAMKSDIKAFLRELALTRTYQRSSEPRPGGSADQEDPSRFAVAPLRPLTPEQLAWSVMQGLGLVEANRAEAIAQLETRDPKMKAILESPAGRTLREPLIEEFIDRRLEPSVRPFIQRFALAPGQPQDGGDSTVHQALFLANGEPIQSWLHPSGTNLTARLANLTTPERVAEELYLSLLTRRPVPDELAEVARYLQNRETNLDDHKTAALKDLAWSLLASVEFRFNH